MKITLSPSLRSSLTLAFAIGLTVFLILLALATPPTQAAVAGLLVTAAIAATLLHLSTEIVVEDDELSIRTLTTSFHEQVHNLNAATDDKVDFRHDEHYGIKRLFRGTNLAGFRVGWFVLNDGKVAFVCVTRKRRARAMETRDGYLLLLDPRIARRIEQYRDLHAT